MLAILSLFLIPFIIFLIAIPFVIKYIVAKKFEKIAFMKGYGTQIHSFAMCFWLGIVRYIYVLALPNLTLINNNIKINPPNNFS